MIYQDYSNLLLLGATGCKIELFSQDSTEPFEICPEKLKQDGYKDTNNNLCMKINERNKTTGRLFLFYRYKSYESPCNWKLNLQKVAGPIHKISKPEEKNLPTAIKKVCFMQDPSIEHMKNPPCTGEECEQTTNNLHHEVVSEIDVEMKKMKNDTTTNASTNHEKVDPISDVPISSPRARNKTMKMQDSNDNSPGGEQNIQAYGILIIMAFVSIFIT